MHGYHFLLRTRRKVRTVVALLFLGYNLKRVIKVLGFEGLMKRLEALIAQVTALLHAAAAIMLFFLSLLQKSIFPPCCNGLSDAVCRFFVFIFLTVNK